MCVSVWRVCDVLEVEPDRVRSVLRVCVLGCEGGQVTVHILTDGVCA